MTKIPREVTIEKTKQRILDRCKERVDVDVSKYTAYKGKIPCKCLKHNLEYKANPKTLLKTQNLGCPECIKESSIEAAYNAVKGDSSSNFLMEEVQQIAAKKSNNNVSLIEKTYKNRRAKCDFYCSKHKLTFQSSVAALRSCKTQICPKCKNELKKTNGTRTVPKSVEYYIEKSVEKFGTNFSFNIEQYTNCCTSFEITCKKHNHTFALSFGNHLKSTFGGCKFCYEEAKKTGDQFKTGMLPKSVEYYIEKSVEKFGTNFSFNIEQYANSYMPFQITCKKHNHAFSLSFRDHLSATFGGCKFCYEESKTTRKIKRFIKKHGDKFDYGETNFNTNEKKIEVRCKKHNCKFKVHPNIHYNTNAGGCPQCTAEGYAARFNKTSTVQTLAALKQQNKGKTFTHKNRKYTCNEEGEVTHLSCKDCESMLHTNNFRLTKKGTWSQKCHECSSYLTPEEKEARLYQAAMYREEQAEEKRLKRANAFIESSKKKYGDNYKINIDNYTKSDEPIKVICQKHQCTIITTPAKHLGCNWGGCKDCSQEQQKIKRIKRDKKKEELKKQGKFLTPPIWTKKEAEALLKSLFGGRYKFLDLTTEGVRSEQITKERCECSEHGVFETNYYSLLKKGNGPCKECLCKNNKRRSEPKFWVDTWIKHIKEYILDYKTPHEMPVKNLFGCTPVELMQRIYNDKYLDFTLDSVEYNINQFFSMYNEEIYDAFVENRTPVF